MNNLDVGKVIEEHGKLIDSLAFRQWSRIRTIAPHIDLDDLKQEARLRLLIDLPRFDSARCSLRGFIAFQCHAGMVDFIRSAANMILQGRTGRTMPQWDRDLMGFKNETDYQGDRRIDFNGPVDRIDSLPSLDPGACERMVKADEVRFHLAKLSPKHRRVVEDFFYNDLTLAEIGRRLNVCESRVSQLIRKALTVMRGPDAGNIQAWNLGYRGQRRSRYYHKRKADTKSNREHGTPTD